MLSFAHSIERQELTGLSYHTIHDTKHIPSGFSVQAGPCYIEDRDVPFRGRFIDSLSQQVD